MSKKKKIRTVQIGSTIRMLVEQLYDIQKLRIEAFNRLVAYAKTAGIPEQINKDKPPLPSAVAKMWIAHEIHPHDIDDLLWYHNSLHETEKNLAKRLNGWSGHHILRINWLSKIKGIGPIFSSALIAWLEPIDRFDNISKVWKYSGLAPGQKRRKGEKLGYNPHLKTLMWKIACSFEKQNPEKSQYRRLYTEIKAKYVVRPDLKKAVDDKVKGAKLHIRLMAMRYTVKRFLADTWTTWRKLEGLSVTEPYAIRVLGHTGYEPPKTDNEPENSANQYSNAEPLAT